MAVDDTLAQRATLVGATIDQGEDGAVACAEHRDRVFTHRHRAGAAQGDLLDGPRIHPSLRPHHAVSARTRGW